MASRLNVSLSWMQFIYDLPTYARFGTSLRSFLQSPGSCDSILRDIGERRRSRERLFLQMMKRCVYGWAQSPYLKLLKHVNCEPDDLADLVETQGLDSALRTLGSEGVYVSVEEFKGKKPIVRGSSTIEVQESSFRNPVSRGQLVASSGGSRSRGLRTVYEFRNLEENWTSHLVVRLKTYDLLDEPIAVWYPVMPGAGPVVVLSLAKAGIFPAWFTPLKVGDASNRMRSRLGNWYIVHIGRYIDKRFPLPEFVPLSDPEPIVQWLVSNLRKRRSCTLMTYVSAAVRVAQKARSLGLSLERAFFSVSSEPLTPSKKKEIELSGATAIPNYSTMESGVIAGGCENPTCADDMHVLDDTLALVQHDRLVEPHGIGVEAFLVTGLLESFPKILFNTETGDYGRMTDRQCGCDFEKLGFSHHISEVYGFDKLTGSGMTFVGSDLVKVLEEVLPARFGGSALDYQMVEDEDSRGQTRLVLLASPSLGVLDESEIRKTVLSALARTSEANHLMSRIWNEAETLQIRRREPVPTARGKLLPLHLKSARRDQAGG